MAAATIHFSVFSGQGIVCLAMIELLMAVSAFAGRGFISGAADDFAGDRCFDRRVAFFTTHGFMEAF